MEGGLSQNQAMSKIKAIVGHWEGLVDENGNNLSQTAGYVDEAIVSDISDNLSEFKVFVEALSFGIDFSAFR